MSAIRNVRSSASAASSIGASDSGVAATSPSSISPPTADGGSMKPRRSVRCASCESGRFAVRQDVHMADFGVDVDPGEVGLDESRLQRIDAHFTRYVDDGRLPGYQVMVSRRGKVAHLSSYGLADREAERPVEADTIWRIYSMTKPVTSVAAMMLWERGLLELTDPISRWLPEFAEMRVYVAGPATKPVTVPATEPIRVWHLLTHTAGLTYGFHRVHVTDEIYRLAGFDLGMPAEDLAAFSPGIAALPLAFQPGAE